jgi:tetratricopeptide (TPR) repeat protein
MTMARRAIVAGIIAAVVIATVLVYRAYESHRGLPSAESPQYEQATRQFYRGLAELQVGLLDAAVQHFGEAATIAPGEPAAWANLGLAELRLGDFDAAAAPIARAVDLAPRSGAVMFLRAQLEGARGDTDGERADLQRTIALEPHLLRARMALVQSIEDAGGDTADADAARVLDELAAQEPNNLAVLVERARLAAKRGDTATVTAALDRMTAVSAGWPQESRDELQATATAARQSDAAGATRALAFLRNTLAQVPAYLDDRQRVTPSAQLIADPFTNFLRLPAVTAAPAPADAALSYAFTVIGDEPAMPPSAVAIVSLDGTGAPAVFAADARGIYRADAPGLRVAWPGAGAAPAAVGPHALAAIDWNNDFRSDLIAAGPRGVRLFIQSENGTFTDDTAHASQLRGLLPIVATGVWTADIEMDGDLDAIVGVRGGVPVVLRNNGDGTWTVERPFDGLQGLRAFAWADVDGDGDPDAVCVDDDGSLVVFANLQGGRFQRMAGPDERATIDAMAVGDVTGNGRFDIVTLDARSAIRRATYDGSGWQTADIATWTDRPSDSTGGGAKVMLADLDNNGALDVVASSSTGTAIWLAGADRGWQRLDTPVTADVRAVVDMTGDGQLDFVGIQQGRLTRLAGRGTRGYHYQVIRPRAQPSAGDQRINSFGIGGEIEVRSGLFVARQTIASPVTHVGLGTRSTVDVMRIVWPNGVLQADFDQGVDQTVVAQQRLKGSCPWVFANDGTGPKFVTDFLWRSPLGLRINAVDTAGVTQTEDWVKIRGDQLAPVGGVYDIRITAELWETHFIDAVSLMAVDHQKDVDVFVDERFSPADPPNLAVHALRPPAPIARAWDDAGTDVTALVAEDDGRYLDTFARGQYQGLAADHFVEVDLGRPIAAGAPMWLVADGWIYPTDSSINVAIGQGQGPKPHGLSLEAQDSRGQWHVVSPDLGFPEGKNKTVLIDLSAVARAGLVGARRVRLRTNLEIYWDAIRVADGVANVPVRTTRLEASRADLRYRGFSETRTASRTSPELPIYDRVANTAPRWRDLAGYYTRFGDVRPLLAKVEDRYVIMNAGDELRLAFPALPPPAAGWTRDFVLIGDGWEKDGDYNTSYSKTVLPLPSHHAPRYESASTPPTLTSDPVYQRYPEDWQTYHTRYVTPRAYLDGLELRARGTE